jgi:hypothetical protein
LALLRGGGRMAPGLLWMGRMKTQAGWRRGLCVWGLTWLVVGSVLFGSGAGGARDGSAWASDLCSPDGELQVRNQERELARLLGQIALLSQHADADLEQAIEEGDRQGRDALRVFRADVAATLELFDSKKSDDITRGERFARAQEARSLLGERYAELKHQRAHGHNERVDRLEWSGRVARGAQIGINGAAVALAAVASGGAGAAGMGALLDGVSNASEQYQERGSVDSRELLVHTGSGAAQGVVTGALGKPIAAVASRVGARVAAELGGSAAATTARVGTDLALTAAANVALGAAGAVGEAAVLRPEPVTVEDAADIAKATVEQVASVEGVMGIALSGAGRLVGLRAARGASVAPGPSKSEAPVPKLSMRTSRPEFEVNLSGVRKLSLKAVLPTGERLPEGAGLDFIEDGLRKIRGQAEALRLEYEDAFQARVRAESRRGTGGSKDDAKLLAARKAEVQARVALENSERDAFDINFDMREAVRRIEASVDARIAMHARRNPFPVSSEREALETGSLWISLMRDKISARVSGGQAASQKRWTPFEYGKAKAAANIPEPGELGDADRRLNRFSETINQVKGGRAWAREASSDGLLRRVRERTPGYSALSLDDRDLIGKVAELMTDHSRFEGFLGRILKQPRVRQSEGTSEYRKRVVVALAHEARQKGFNRVKVLPARGLEAGEFASFLARRELFLDPAFRKGAHGEDTHLVQMVYLLDSLGSDAERQRIFDIMATHPTVWGEMLDGGVGTLSQPETLGKALRNEIGLY